MSNELTNEQLVSTAITAAKNLETILRSALIIGLSQTAANMAGKLALQTSAAVVELERRVNEEAAKKRNTQ